jgi:hypothetical protein
VPPGARERDQALDEGQQVAVELFLVGLEQTVRRARILSSASSTIFTERRPESSMGTI